MTLTSQRENKGKLEKQHGRHSSYRGVGWFVYR